jgi:hypothetical protein
VFWPRGHANVTSFVPPINIPINIRTKRAPNSIESEQAKENLSRVHQNTKARSTCEEFCRSLLRAHRYRQGDRFTLLILIIRYLQRKLDFTTVRGKHIKGGDVSVHPSPEEVKQVWRGTGACYNPAHDSGNIERRSGYATVDSAAKRCHHNRRE